MIETPSRYGKGYEEHSKRFPFRNLLTFRTRSDVTLLPQYGMLFTTKEIRLDLIRVTSMVNYDAKCLLCLKNICSIVKLYCFSKTRVVITNCRKTLSTCFHEAVIASFSKALSLNALSFSTSRDCERPLFLYTHGSKTYFNLKSLLTLGMFSGSFSIMYVSLTRINGTGMFSGSFSICLTYSYKWDRNVLRFFFYMSHLLV